MMRKKLSSPCWSPSFRRLAYIELSKQWRCCYGGRGGDSEGLWPSWFFQSPMQFRVPNMERSSYLGASATTSPLGTKWRGVGFLEFANVYNLPTVLWIPPIFKVTSVRLRVRRLSLNYHFSNHIDNDHHFRWDPEATLFTRASWIHSSPIHESSPKCRQGRHIKKQARDSLPQEFIASWLLQNTSSWYV